MDVLDRDLQDYISAANEQLHLIRQSYSVDRQQQATSEVERNLNLARKTVWCCSTNQRSINRRLLPHSLRLLLDVDDGCGC
jgi:hypothetical protein